MNKKIQAISEDKEFKFEMTKLMEKSVFQLNETAEIINQHSEIIRSIQDEIESIKKNLDSFDYELQSGIAFTNLLSRIRAIYAATDNKIRDIHQSLVDLQNNVFNTKIITYKTIIDELKQIKIVGKFFPRDVSVSLEDERRFKVGGDVMST